MKSGNLNFLNPLGHSRPVTGLIFLRYVLKVLRHGDYVSRSVGFYGLTAFSDTVVR